MYLVKSDILSYWVMMINRTKDEDASKGTRLIYPKTVKSLVKTKKQAKYVQK